MKNGRNIEDRDEREWCAFRKYASQTNEEQQHFLLILLVPMLDRQMHDANLKKNKTNKPLVFS